MKVISGSILTYQLNQEIGCAVYAYTLFDFNRLSVETTKSYNALMYRYLKLTKLFIKKEKSNILRTIGSTIGK